jgi:electron transport complex protein RnfB
MRQVDATDIDALLPQTQCTRCGYNGCLPYAQALADGGAQINQCPPGGSALIGALAALLECEPLPLDPKFGVESPPQLAWIDPQECIGCARCLPPCPVDAILGAQRKCTGDCFVVHGRGSAFRPAGRLPLLPWPQRLRSRRPSKSRSLSRSAARRADATERERELRQLKQRGGRGATMTASAGNLRPCATRSGRAPNC